jgi:curved DNA-binding protein CbpA
MDKLGNIPFPDAAAGPAELKKRYRELIMRYHPDHNPDKQDWSTRMMQELNAAYDILRETLYKSGPAPGAEPQQDMQQVIAAGDDAVCEAVFKGWLSHTPRDPGSVKLRQRINRAAESLKNRQLRSPSNPRREYFHTFFTLFIRTTDPETLLPFTGAVNTTRFFRILSRANRKLAAGMHIFYSSREKKSFQRLSGVVVSDLEEARWLYRSLLLENRSRVTRLENHLESRLELADLFRLRLEEPRLYA